MVNVTIRIEASAPTDPYYRYHGLAVSEALPGDFWKTRSDLVMGVTRKNFSFVKTFDLPPGSYRITYGNSGYANDPRFPDYGWRSRILIDGKPMAEGLVGRHDHLIYTLNIGVGPKETNWLLIGILGAAAVAGLYFLTKKK